MAARVQKKHAKSYTTAQRYSILEKFAHFKEQDKMTNVDAAAKVGVPFITLYSWIRNEMWKDSRHATPPIRLQERARKETSTSPRRGRPKKALHAPRKERMQQLPAAAPKTILRKAKPKAEHGGAVALPPLAKPVETPHPISEDKPIIVRLPNGVEIEFPDLAQARDFAKSLP